MPEVLKDEDPPPPPPLPAKNANSCCQQTSTKCSVSNTCIKIYCMYTIRNLRFSPQGTLSSMEVQQRPWDMRPAVITMSVDSSWEAVARTAAACSSCYLLRQNAWPCVPYLSSFQCCYFCDPTVLKSLLPAIEKEQVVPSTISPGKWCLFPCPGTSVEITCSTLGPEKQLGDFFYC